MIDKQPRVARWECPNCGQSYFGDNPPDMCDFCEDFTTWRPLHGPQTPPKPGSKRHPPDERAQQPRLFDDSNGN
jgi:rubredoxin